MWDSKSRARKAPVTATLVFAMLIALVATAPLARAERIKPEKGNYTGKIKTEDVVDSVRSISFTVKKGKITLTEEPVLRRHDCLSPPIFLLNQDSVSTELSKSGKFKFEHTIFGTKVDKIKGQFTSRNKIEGEVTDHFQDQYLCKAGKKTVKFTAKPGTSTTAGS